MQTGLIYDFTQSEVLVLIVAVVIIVVFPYLLWKKKGQKWVENKLDFFRDLSTLLAVLFAAFLSGWLTGGDLSLPFPGSEISTHPFLTPTVIVTAVLFFGFALLTLYADWRRGAVNSR